MGLSSSIPDEKLFPVPERVRERRRTEVGDPAPRPQQGMRNHQIDDGKLLGDDPLHFEIGPPPLLRVELAHLAIHELVDARFPGRGRRGLLRVPRVERAGAQPEIEVRRGIRVAGQTAAQLQASLEANGFACENERRLDCRIEIMERQCAFDWYVVLERGEREPVAGFDQMCLGANR